MERAPVALILVLFAVGCAGAPPAADLTFLVLPERASLGLPYSDAVRAGNLLFLSGTVGVAPGSRTLVGGGVRAETRQALANVAANLAAHGASMDSVAKCTVFLADIGDFDAMNEAYREAFSSRKPARTTVGVSGLPLGARVEIDCIAVVEGHHE